MTLEEFKAKCEQIRKDFMRDVERAYRIELAKTKGGNK